MKSGIFDLGLTDFRQAWEFQKSIFLRVKQNELSSALILCRHLPVITIGRSGKKENILSGDSQLEKLNIKIYEIERGGDATYHGPGQLCIYPIINLADFKKDINWYLRSLEVLLLDVLSDFGIKAQTRPGLTGIWTGRKKLASIGISVRNWITFHGAALNVKNDDLANFSLIRPCGMDIIMTSMEDVLNEEVRFDKIKRILTRRWYEAGSFAGAGRGD
ncbi:MAG: lipoyl(octanoyl) transferase LipB [Candidatus Omnitrophota bacterium]